MNIRPHTLLLLVCSLACGFVPGLRADLPVASADTVASDPAPLTPAQLDELFAPVALYPDPLIAIILPASTVPADIVLAARYLQGGGTADAIETQPWDDSVKALARYPELVKWLDENLAWTRQVGAAFSRQPADVLTCTQRLRAAARAAGNLKDSPEQTVIVERETIRIVPARPEIIYVPVYEPSWVYGYSSVDFYHPGPRIRFSSGYRTGHWLAYYCDWNRWNVVIINRPYRAAVWQSYPRWHCPGPAVAQTYQVWRPDPVRTRASFRSSETVGRPARSGAQQNAAARDQALPAAGANLSAPSASRPAAQAGAPSTTRPAASPVQPPSGFRRGQISQSDGSATVPSRGQTQVDSPRRNRPAIATAAPNPGTASAPAPSAPPALGVSTPSQRIQFPNTSGGGPVNLPAHRPRPAGALVLPSASAPARESTATLAAPKRPSELRTPVPATSASVPAAGAVGQPPPQSRMRSWESAASPASPTIPSEPDASGSRRTRR